MAKANKNITHVVIAPFRDRKEFGNNSYLVGDDVSHFTAERLESLITRNLVGSPANAETEDTE